MSVPIRQYVVRQGQEVRLGEYTDGQRFGVSSLSVTPDGRRAVSGYSDHTLRVWEIDSGQCLLTLRGHKSGVTGVSITPDGKHVVSGSEDHSLRLWNIDLGQCLRIFQGHTAPVTRVAVTPDGRRVVSGSDDNSVLVWDIDSGECLQRLQGHTDWITTVNVTPNGGCVVSGSADNSLRLWDIQSGQCLHTFYASTFHGHTSGVSSVSITHDGRRAVSGSFDGTVRLWDLLSGQSLALFHADGGIHCVANIRDSVNIVCGTAKGIHFLSLRNFASPGPAIVTPIDPNHFRCPYCGTQCMTPPEVIAVISSLSDSLESVSHISGYDFEDQKLLASCPQCDQRLKFNAFSIERNIGTEIRNQAKLWLERGLWEAAETALQKLLDMGDPPSKIIPDLVNALLNTHNQIMPTTSERIAQLLQQLEESGHNELANELRQQHAAKCITLTKRPWWKVW